MLYYVYPTTIWSKLLHWCTITAQVDQGYAATTKQQHDLIHSFKKIGYNRFLEDAGHNLNQVYGEGYLRVPKSLPESSYALINTCYTPYTTVKIISKG